MSKNYSNPATSDYEENPELDNLVPPGCACPKCRENRMDYLIINEADEVICQTCGNEYSVEGKNG